VAALARIAEHVSPRPIDFWRMVRPVGVDCVRNRDAAA
jgi:hypothetical protein